MCTGYTNLKTLSTKFLLLFYEGVYAYVLLKTNHVFSDPWCRDIAERYYEYHFRPFMFVGVLTCSLGISLCALSKSPLIDGLLFGILGGKY